MIFLSHKLLHLTLLSDTHGLHRELTKSVGSGDLIIHAGDVTEYGTAEELEDFIDWFSNLNFRHKIFVGGNHDLILEEMGQYLTEWRGDLPKNTYHLENESVEIERLKMWGSPCSPYFMGMAFNKRRGKEMKQVWDKIPLDTDILITHTPPLGILDNDSGCEELTEKLNALNPKLHVFGHIHQSFGIEKRGQKTFVNASIAGQQNVDDMPPFIINSPIKLNF